MTILEVVVAIALLTSAIFAGVSTFDAVSHSTIALGHRTRAVEIAEREIETMRSVAYARIGLSPADVGFVATFERASTVRVEDPVIRPNLLVTESSQAFRIERHVTWVDVSPPDGAVTLGAYKRLTVLVTWRDTSVGSVRLDSGVSPFAQPEACARRDTDGSPMPVTGVINRFVAGLADVVSGATVVAAQDTGRGGASMNPGDLILIIQMGGPDAGVYEYARAASELVNDRLAVTGEGADGGLLNSYSAAGRFQVIRVPTFASTSLAKLSTLPWDGTTGGVLAVDVAGVATLEGPIDASATGFADPGLAPVDSTPRRLLPGRGDSPGGGLILVRASSFAGSGAVVSDGGDRVGAGKGGGGDGGTVVIAAESGGLDAPAVSARATGSGRGGSALLSSPPGSMDLSGGSSNGSAVTNLDGRDLVGTPLGVGCQPALSITNSSTFKEVVNDGLGTAEYTLTVRSQKEHGTATGVTVIDPLPGGFSYLSTSKVETFGGATQVAKNEPTVGDVAPRWGTFTVPAGAGLIVTFTAAISPQVAPGVVGDGARVNYATANGASTAVFDEAMSDSDDVTVKPFACPTPSTDPAPPGGLSGVVNTYYPGVSTVASGATSVRVGAPVGAATPIAAGDMLLILQMQGATIDPSDSPAYGDGPGGVVSSGSTSLNETGRYEYVVATGPAASSAVRIIGSGVAGGLINSYVSAPATGTIAARAFQVVRVPSYPDVRLVSLGATAWNGSAGGVLAVDVAGQLDLAKGSASVDAAGFRGGGSVARTTSGNSIRDNSGARGGAKGEGVAGTPRSIFADGSVADLGVDGIPAGGFGQGAPADAGGGGGVSAGGGGGSNGGSGGSGGTSAAPIANGSGSGGSLPVLAASRVLLGGGGGATQLDAGQSAVGGGGRGGGAVFLRSTTIVGSGTINANGAVGSTGSKKFGTETGGGGGGAGGTVIISTTTSSLASLSVSTRGGAGGGVADASSTVGAGGGGGGGGRVLSTAEVTATVDGGTGGVPVNGESRSTDGRAGRSVRLSTSDIAGQAVGQGCRPLLVVSTTTSTPTVLRVHDSTAHWTATVSNLSGHLGALAIGVTDILPAGFALFSTDSIALAGGATRSAVSDPSGGSAVPTWGSFDLPGGGSVQIDFSATVPGAAVGTVGNSVQAGASYFGSTIASKYSDADGAADDVTVADPVTRLFAQTMVDQLTTGSPTTTTDELWTLDGAVVTTGSFPVVADQNRHIDVDFNSAALPPQSGPLRPQPDSVTVSASFAATAPGATVCLVPQVGSAVTSTFFVGSKQPMCVTGTNVTRFDFNLPARSWSGIGLASLRVRLVGTSSTSQGVAIDQVGVDVGWQGSTFHLQPTSAVDASTGIAAAPWVARATAVDAASFVTGGAVDLAAAFSSSQFVETQFPSEIPSGATISSVSGSLRWKVDRPATVCWHLDLRSGGARIGGVGSASSPACHIGADAAASDPLVLPSLTLAQINDLTARIYVKTTSGSARTVAIDQFSLDVTWSRP